MPVVKMIDMAIQDQNFIFVGLQFSFALLAMYCKLGCYGVSRLIM